MALDFLKAPVLAIQDFYSLSVRAVQNVFLRPHYVDDIFLQMDIIGVGSLPIVILTGFFSGAVMGCRCRARSPNTARKAKSVRLSRSRWCANSVRC